MADDADAAVRRQLAILNGEDPNVGPFDLATTAEDHARAEMVNQPDEVEMVNQPDQPDDETPIIFYTRDEFLARRDEVIARTMRRLAADPEFHDRLLAEIYAGSLETRLVADRLDAFAQHVDKAMQKGMLSKVLGTGKG